MTTRHALLFIESAMIPFRMPPLCQALEARGFRPVLVPTDGIPTHVRLQHRDEADGTRLTVDVGEGPVTVGPHDVVWAQSPSVGGGLVGHLTGEVLRIATDESQSLLDGFLQSLPCPCYPSHTATWASVSKGYQHKVARAAGLITPRSLVTNDPDAARAFLATCRGGAILKPVDRAVLTRADGQAAGLGTRLVTPEIAAGLDALRWSPLILQERVARAAELRVVVFGTRVFSAAFDAHQVAADCVDWRTQPQLYDAWRPWELPPDVERRLLDVHDRLGLEIGVADLIVTPEGAHVFLETNSWGQYYWLEMGAPHFPLSEALADVLAGVPGARRSAA